MIENYKFNDFLKALVIGLILFSGGFSGFSWEWFKMIFDTIIITTAIWLTISFIFSLLTKKKKKESDSWRIVTVEPSTDPNCGDAIVVMGNDKGETRRIKMLLFPENMTLELLQHFAENYNEEKTDEK